MANIRRDGCRVKALIQEFCVAAAAAKYRPPPFDRGGGGGAKRNFGVF